MSHPAAVDAPWRDPLVWLGATLGAAFTAHALFAGPYLPYIDWSNHLALISVLADGGESGALEFMTRSWAPTPYLLYYALAAGLAQGMSVVTAAKVLLVLSAGLLAIGGAQLVIVRAYPPSERAAQYHPPQQLRRHTTRA